MSSVIIITILSVYDFFSARKVNYIHGWVMIRAFSLVGAERSNFFATRR